MYNRSMTAFHDNEQKYIQNYGNIEIQSIKALDHIND